MYRHLLPSHKCKKEPLCGDAVPALDKSLSLSFALTFLESSAPQQLAVDLGDLFDVVFQLVVVLDPAANFSHLLLGDDSPGSTPGAQRDRQIPHRPMPLTASALAGRVPTGHVSFHEGTSQDLGDRREQFREALAALAQG